MYYYELEEQVVEIKRMINKLEHDIGGFIVENRHGDYSGDVETLRLRMWDNSSLVSDYLVQSGIYLTRALLVCKKATGDNDD